MLLFEAKYHVQRNLDLYWRLRFILQGIFYKNLTRFREKGRLTLSLKQWQKDSKIFIKTSYDDFLLFSFSATPAFLYRRSFSVFFPSSFLISRISRPAIFIQPWLPSMLGLLPFRMFLFYNDTFFINASHSLNYNKIQCSLKRSRIQSDLQELRAL